MRRIDKMMQDVQIIQRALQPVFFCAMVDKVRAGWRVVCQLSYGKGNGYDTRTSFCPDMESVNRRIEEMKGRYPSADADDPVVIIDNIAEGG